MAAAVRILAAAFLVACSQGLPEAGNDAGECRDAAVDAPFPVDAGDLESEALAACPDGTIRWPEGACAPPIGECDKPWEMPQLGGACAVVGPRTCPKAWQPGSHLACDADEVQPCPAGTDEGSGGASCVPRFEECGASEVPVLGGGCQPIGPEFEWGGLEAPSFDECATGQLALPGGGCVQVGPRTCPKLWNIHAEADCEVGDILPCPPGWVEGSYGLFCEPLYDECGPGERPVLGGGCIRVVPVAAECPEGPFPQAPEGAAAVVHVDDDSPCQTGCGSKASPFPSLAAAVAAAPAGAAVLIAPGGYPQGVLVNKPVALVGLCAATVVLSGEVKLPQDWPLPVSHAGLAVLGADGVSVTGLTVESDAAALVVADSKDVSVSGCALVGAGGGGAYVEGSEVSFEAVWIHDTAASTGPLEGSGVTVRKGAKVSLTDGLVETARTAGISVSDAGSAVTVKSSILRDLQAGQGGGGAAVVVGNGASGTVDGSLLSDAVAAGMDCQGTCDVVGTSIRHVQPDQNGDRGAAVLAAAGAKATIVDSAVTDSWLGVHCSGQETVVAMAGSVVKDTVPHTSLTGALEAEGAEAWQGCVLWVDGSAVVPDSSAGVGAIDPGSKLVVRGSWVGREQEDYDWVFADGIAGSMGAQVEVYRSVVEGAGETGIESLDNDLGGAVGVVESTVRGNLEVSPWRLSIGISGGIGSEALVRSVLVEDTGASGLELGGGGFASSAEVEMTVVRGVHSNLPGAGRGMGLRGGNVTVHGAVVEEIGGMGVFAAGMVQAKLQDVAVRHTHAPEAETVGEGLQAYEWCHVVLERCLFEDNTGVAVQAMGLGAIVEMRRCLVRETKTDMGSGLAIGVLSWDEGVMTVEDSLVEAVSALGVGAAGLGSALSMEGSLVRKIGAKWIGGDAAAVQALDGASLSVSRSVVKDNLALGVLAAGSGTKCVVSDSLISHSRPDADGRFGYGLQATDGASVELRRSALTENCYAGLVASGQGTDAELVSSTIGRTSQAAGCKQSVGVAVLGGAGLTAFGSALVENAGIALQAAGEGTHVSLHSVVVSGTVPWTDGSNGLGIVAAGEASVELFRCLVAGNRVAGLMASEGAATQASESAFVSTVLSWAPCTGDGCAADTGTFGDGIVAEKATIDVADSIVSGNERAGLYFWHSSGSLAGSLVTGNLSYGLALKESVADVDFDPAGNYVFGNASSLPPQYRTDITYDPGGLPPPDPPSLSWE